MQSDGQSAGHLNPLIDQHVAAGNDILEVQSLGQARGAYSLFTSFTPASDPSQTVGLPADFQGSFYAPPIAVGDFTNNGVTDIVAPDGVHLGPAMEPFWLQRTLRSPTPARHRHQSQSATSTAITIFGCGRRPWA